MNYTVIYQSVITEKTAGQEEKGVYTFWVSENATKIDIKNAVRQLYGAEVSEVKIAQSPSKSKRIRYGNMTKRAAKKKAYVKLKNKEKLDLNNLQSAKEATKKTAGKKEQPSKKPTGKKAKSSK